MQDVPKEVLEGFKEFGTAIAFNAIRAVLGGGPEGEGLEIIGGVPVNYCHHTMLCHLPELGVAVGYAFTSEITTSDPDSQQVSWDGYYDLLEGTTYPTIAVMKDVDTRAGRGAVIGDTMAGIHKMLGTTGMVADGTVRDLADLKRIGFPVWGIGTASGHGLHHLIRFTGQGTRQPRLFNVPGI